MVSVNHGVCHTHRKAEQGRVQVYRWTGIKLKRTHTHRLHTDHTHNSHYKHTRRITCHMQKNKTISIYRPQTKHKR